MLTKRKNGQAGRTSLQALMRRGADRRPSTGGPSCAAPASRSAGMAALGAFQLGTVQKAEAISPPQPGVPIEIRKSICTHCAVGCTVTAEVQNGVWTGQEPSWDSPINRGSHCAKGASVRELVHSDRRLKYPLKLVGGQWERVSWEEAIDEHRRQAHGDPRELRAGLRLLAGLGQVLQRRHLPLPQARRALGDQQPGPPGAHLPFDDRLRRGQHLGLRRDDELVQRHPQLQDDASSWAATRPRRIRSRCSTCSRARS